MHGAYYYLKSQSDGLITVRRARFTASWATHWQPPTSWETSNNTVGDKKERKEKEKGVVWYLK